jgi:hypothetical protein
LFTQNHPNAERKLRQYFVGNLKLLKLVPSIRCLVNNSKKNGRETLAPTEFFHTKVNLLLKYSIIDFDI